MSDDLIDLSRRDLLRHIGLSLSLSTAGANVLTAQDAAHVHHLVAADKSSGNGQYQPKLFTAHEYATLRKLADLIVPADSHSKGALEAGAPEFIDLLASA